MYVRRYYYCSYLLIPLKSYSSIQIKAFTISEMCMCTYVPLHIIPTSSLYLSMYADSSFNINSGQTECQLKMYVHIVTLYVCSFTLTLIYMDCAGSPT